MVFKSVFTEGEFDMEEAELRKILENAPTENDHWDFKAQWYDDNGELIKDIINFVNTVHHDDCYIIIGVDDESGKIEGVEKDKNSEQSLDPKKSNSNRKNKQQLQDLLRVQSFAQNWFPKTNVETFNIKGHEIDVITIYNSNDVPIFLSKVNKKYEESLEQGMIYSKNITDSNTRSDNSVNVKVSKKKSKPGLIYSRIGDSNTPSDNSVNDKVMEELWRKRFRLDLKIKDRFKFLLKKPTEWDFIPYEGIVSDKYSESYVYSRDPNYVVKVGKQILEEKNTHFDSFAMSGYDIRFNWYNIFLIYGATVVYANYLISIPNNQSEFILPDCSYLDLHKNQNSSHETRYYYYIEDDLSYIITKLLNSFLIEKNNKSCLDNLKKDIVIYKNMEEKEICENLLKDEYKNKNISLNTSEDKIEDIVRKILSNDFNNDFDNDRSHQIAKKMMKEHVIVNYIKQLQSKKERS